MEKKQNLRRYMDLIVGLLLYSLGGVLAKWIMLDTYSIIFGRSLVACALLWGWCMINGYSLSLKECPKKKLIVSAILLLGFWVGFIQSVKYVGVFVAISLYLCHGLISLIVEWIKLRLTKRVSVYSTGIMVGVVCIYLSDPTINMVIGIGYGLMAALTFSCRNFWVKDTLSMLKPSVLLMYELALLSGVLVMCIPNIVHAPVIEWYKLLIMGVAATAVCHSLIIKSLCKFSVSFIGGVLCLEPVIASYFDYILFKAVPTLPVIIGACIISGLAIFESLKNISVESKA